MLRGGKERLDRGKAFFRGLSTVCKCARCIGSKRSGLQTLSGCRSVPRVIKVGSSLVLTLDVNSSASQSPPPQVEITCGPFGGGYIMMIIGEDV